MLYDEEKRRALIAQTRERLEILNKAIDEQMDEIPYPNPLDAPSQALKVDVQGVGSFVVQRSALGMQVFANPEDDKQRSYEDVNQLLDDLETRTDNGRVTVPRDLGRLVFYTSVLVDYLGLGEQPAEI